MNSNNSNTLYPKGSLFTKGRSQELGSRQKEPVGGENIWNCVARFQKMLVEKE